MSPLYADVFDMQISQTDKAYYDLLIKYNRILQQRNRLLKDIRDNNASIELLVTWDQEFVLTAARIAVKRLAALQKLKNIAKDIYAALTGELETLTVFMNLKLIMASFFILMKLSVGKISIAVSCLNGGR